MTEKDLLALKEQIENAKSEINKLEGRKANLLETLVSEFGCDSIEDAEKKLKALEAKEKQIQAKIEKNLEKLEESYDVEE